MADKKIISYITDGLGNQLFQYAFAYALSKRYGQALYIDNTYFQYNNFRKYELDKFNIEENLQVFDQDISMKIYEEPHFHFDKFAISINDSVFLKGFWQSEKYFENIKDELKNLYTFKNFDFIVNPHYLKLIESTNSIAVHIRTGDYLTLPHKLAHFVCGQKYYNNAIEYIKKIVENPTFFIFSDDIKTAQQFLPSNTNLILVETQNWQEDFYFMQKTKHNIISNSTFSWWAAWLNCNPQKIVLAPDKWFTDITPLNDSDIIPDNWIKITT
ncbi:MAG: alpha-1,2-fucosyltransferase [Candidatus Gastranaerophilales bacterium]|nr:alpha-1,2-fucosyltransferase [Candidatus Gastranaerophilales bacterium]